MSVRIAPSVLSADLGRLREQVEQADRRRRRLDPRGRDGRALRAEPHVRRAAHPGAPAAHRPAARRAPDGASSPSTTSPSTPTRAPTCSPSTPRPRSTCSGTSPPCASAGMLAGLALNPGTPLALLEEVVADLDLVLVMSVNPGFGGQSYLPAATDKIRRVRALLDRHRSPRRARGGRRHHRRHHRRGLGRGRGHLRGRHRGVRRGRSRGGGARAAAPLRRASLRDTMSKQWIFVGLVVAGVAARRDHHDQGRQRGRAGGGRRHGARVPRDRSRHRRLGLAARALPRQGDPGEHLGHLVRAVPGRDAGDGAALRLRSRRAASRSRR